MRQWPTYDGLVPVSLVLLFGLPFVVAATVALSPLPPAGRGGVLALGIVVAVVVVQLDWSSGFDALGDALLAGLSLIGWVLGFVLASFARLFIRVGRRPSS
jgi:hypothetical protein